MQKRTVGNLVEFQLYYDVPEWAGKHLYAIMYDSDERVAWNKIVDIAKTERINLRVYDEKGKCRGTVLM